MRWAFFFFFFFFYVSRATVCLRYDDRGPLSLLRCQRNQLPPAKIINLAILLPTFPNIFPRKTTRFATGFAGKNKSGISALHTLYQRFKPEQCTLLTKMEGSWAFILRSSISRAYTFPSLVY